MLTKIVVKGPALSRSGYGEQTRFALRALRSREDIFDIYIINIRWGGTGHVAQTTEETTWIHGLLAKTATYLQQTQGQPGFDISVQVTIPLEFEKMAISNIGYTAGIECNKISPKWIEKTNETVDKIITISEHSQNVFKNTQYDALNQATGETVKGWSVKVPVEVVGYPVREIESQPIDVEFSTSKNFMVVSQWGPRKNLDNTIRWFVEEFQDDPDVGLVLKTNTMNDSILDREKTITRLKSLLNEEKQWGVENRQCKIYLLHGELTEGQLAWLYQHPTMQGLINIAHGEGFGLPLFEAAYNSLPLITVTWGGQLDFICKTNKKGKRVPYVVPVDYSIAPVQKSAIWPGVIEENTMWAYAREASYKRALRETITRQKHHRQRARALKKEIVANFKEDELLERFVSYVHKEPDTEVVEWLKKIEEISEL